MQNMELLSVGQKIYPGMQVLLWHTPQENFIPELGLGTRFRLILVEKGAGLLRLNDRRLAFSAPLLLCINERETLIMEESENLHAAGLYFHPSIINDSFSFENVRGEPQNFKHTDWQDRAWMWPFVEREGKRNGLLSLAPITASRIAHQVAIIGRELSEQRDGFWPCRSRSFLLELLFLIHRLYSEPDTAAIGGLSPVATSKEIGKVILYLHIHYGEKTNLTKLAYMFHTNRTTLTKQFRAATGFSVMAYLINLRVHLASLMLRNTQISVTEVRERVGFVDDTHFIRTFRKYTRYTPSEYRQHYSWMIPHENAMIDPGHARWHLSTIAG
jgi:AraC-like DNA-binding protein